MELFERHFRSFQRVMEFSDVYLYAQFFTTYAGDGENKNGNEHKTKISDVPPCCPDHLRDHNESNESVVVRYTFELICTPTTACDDDEPGDAPLLKSYRRRTQL